MQRRPGPATHCRPRDGHCVLGARCQVGRTPVPPAALSLTGPRRSVFGEARACWAKVGEEPEPSQAWPEDWLWFSLSATRLSVRIRLQQGRDLRCGATLPWPTEDQRRRNVWSLKGPLALFLGPQGHSPFNTVTRASAPAGLPKVGRVASSAVAELVATLLPVLQPGPSATCLSSLHLGSSVTRLLRGHLAQGGSGLQVTEISLSCLQQ